MAGRDLAVIKGDRGGLCLVIDGEADMASIIDVLRERLQSSPAFFRGAALRIETPKRDLSDTDRELLATTVQEFGMIISAHDASDPAPQVTRRHGPARSSTVSNVSAPSTRGGNHTMQEHEDGRAILVKRTLRSGQSITFDGDVIVRGDVNPGAVITSTGDIIVLGALRGVAHAGASGDLRAVVMAFRLEPTQLRIAGAISRAPDEKPARPAGPEIARVKDDMILIEAYQ